MAAVAFLDLAKVAGLLFVLASMLTMGLALTIRPADLRTLAGVAT